MNRLERQLMVILIFACGVPAMAADPTFAMVGVARGVTPRLNMQAFPINPCNAVELCGSQRHAVSTAWESSQPEPNAF